MDKTAQLGTNRPGDLLANCTLGQALAASRLGGLGGRSAHVAGGIERTPCRTPCRAPCAVGAVPRGGRGAARARKPRMCLSLGHITDAHAKKRRVLSAMSCPPEHICGFQGWGAAGAGGGPRLVAEAHGSPHYPQFSSFRVGTEVGIEVGT